MNLGGWVLANPGDTGLLPELWSRVSETKFQIKSPDYLPQKSHFSLNMVVVVLVVLLWADSGPLCDEAGRGSLCSPLRAAEGERGRGGGVEVSGLVKGLMGGWSYSGRGGREDGSFKEGEIYREWAKTKWATTQNLTRILFLTNIPCIALKRCWVACYVYRLIGRERPYPSCCWASNRAALSGTDKTSFLWLQCRFFIRMLHKHGSSNALFLNSDLLIDQMDNKQERRKG